METLRFGAPSFTLACPEMTAHYFIAPYIAAGAPVESIRTAQPAEVYEELRRGADVAINTSEPPPHLASRTLSSTRILVQYSGRPGFDVEEGTVELAKVVQFPMLLARGRAVEALVRRTAMEAGLSLDMATNTTDPVIAQALAAAGRGNAVVLEPVADYDLQQAFVLHGGKPLVVHFYAVWDPAHYAAREIVSFVQDLSAWFERKTPFPTRKRAMFLPEKK
ncbi:LysR substrate-binding domain-containing protein [Arthrobacter sp. SD76]|uniref:LysR substrate-binding domain-containing protein n=1 Tax=Arthrobacter sp. SD76 TaxID=3415007 RepID=UPI003C779EA4